jgi:peptide deformylase
MPAREILLLGNPILRQPCSLVRAPLASDVQSVITDLRDTLTDFRLRHGFGRGIAAPQIGVSQNVIYIDAEFCGAMINPKIVRRGRKKFRLWDDCFSFPDIMVHVERNCSIEVAFVDEHGGTKHLRADGSMSELLQHEIDHLSGILAIDRAIDSKHIVLRSEYEKLQHKAPVAL